MRGRTPLRLLRLVFRSSWLNAVDKMCCKASKFNVIMVLKTSFRRCWRRAFCRPRLKPIMVPGGAAGIQPIVRLLSSGREAVVVVGAADGGWWGLVCELVKVRVSRLEAVEAIIFCLR
jgi:hypothetical protein